MKTKTQELVTAGYALAKGLDAESAKLVKELADELAVQRVRADELNKQVVSLAVENANLKNPANFYPASAESKHAVDTALESGLGEDEALILGVKTLLDGIKTPATDAAIASIQAQGVDKLATFAGKEYQRFVGDKTSQRKWKGIVLLCTDFASQLRKEASNG